MSPIARSTAVTSRIARFSASPRIPIRLLITILTIVSAATAFVTTCRAGSVDGTLLLRWRGAEAIESGISRLVSVPIPKNELVIHVIEPDREEPIFLAMGTPAELRHVQPGQVQLELRHGAGLLHRWQIFVRSQYTTSVEVDLNLGTIEIDPFAPEPFGFLEEWSPEEMTSLPGLSGEAAISSDTRHAAQANIALDGRSFQRLDRLRPQETALVGVYQAAVRPLSVAPAHSSQADQLHLYGRQIADGDVRVGGTIGNGNRTVGYAQLGYRRPSVNHGLLNVGGHLQWSNFDLAGPLEIVGSSRDHDDKEALELYAHAAAYPWQVGRLRLDLYARGDSRQYFLQEFAQNLPHAPKEDRASLLSTLTFDRSLYGGDLNTSLAFDREFSEVGDGRAFNNFLAYNRTLIDIDTTEDDLYWLGDDGETPIDEGRLFDYYEKSVTEDLATHLEWSRNSRRGRFLAGADVHWTTWRLFEHLRPSDVVDSGDSGYQLSRNFGYNLDGSERDSRDGHGAKRARRVGLFASHELSVGAATASIGMRFDRFSPNQNPFRNISDPLGMDDGAPGNPETLDPEDLKARPNHDQVSPRLGLYLPMGRNHHLWLDAGRRQILPPFEAIYYDPEFLARQVSLADIRSNRAARNFIHGNPDLAPAVEQSLQLGLYRRQSANLGIHLSGYAANRTDTWVARRYERAFDWIDIYENGGEEREYGVHLGLNLQPSPSSTFRVQYDLSRRETDVIEPFPLLMHQRLEGLPVDDVASPQTRLRNEFWIDDGIDRGFFPSLLDRTHRISVAWSGSISILGVADGPATPRLGFLFHAASGLPYTPTFLRKEGDLTMSADVDAANDLSRAAGDINSERMPWSWQLDAAYSQPLVVLGKPLALRVEVRNLTNNANPQHVYGATGEADDDGWLGSSSGQSEADQKGSDYESEYRNAIEAPLNYTDGMEARIGLMLELW